ncbi:MAG: MaoC family dehydratase [Desulfuromonadales bacterium]|nr:MaoC family dehydratase [Desulfuromonadales bacterium]MDH4006614.1 MaoC family dehydratase [Desulfuromonadales bacterium]
MSDIKYYWEDLAVGFVDEFGDKLVSKEEILDFARQFDPQPFHLDEEAAAKSLFGGLCASGWHTGAMAMRLLCDRILTKSACLGSPGMENLRFFKPVFVGDRLRMRFEVMESRPLNKRLDVGTCNCRWELFNQHDEMVMQLNGNLMFGRRPAAEKS